MTRFLLILIVCVIIQYLNIGWWVLSITGLWFFRRHLIKQQGKDIIYDNQ